MRQQLDEVHAAQLLPVDELGGERGATAVEYALMLAFIAVVIVGSVSLLGNHVKAIFENNDLLNALL